MGDNFYEVTAAIRKNVVESARRSGFALSFLDTPLASVEKKTTEPEDTESVEPDANQAVETVVPELAQAETVDQVQELVEIGRAHV